MKKENTPLQQAEQVVQGHMKEVKKMKTGYVILLVIVLIIVILIASVIGRYNQMQTKRSMWKPHGHRLKTNINAVLT